MLDAVGFDADALFQAQRYRLRAFAAFDVPHHHSSNGNSRERHNQHQRDYHFLHRYTLFLEALCFPLC